MSAATQQPGSTDLSGLIQALSDQTAAMWALVHAIAELLGEEMGKPTDAQEGDKVKGPQYMDEDEAA